MDYMSLVLTLEEIAAGDGATSTIVSVQNSLACGITMKYGSDEQKETWLKPLARGDSARLFLPDRAAHRLRRLGDHHPRRPRRRPFRAQRRQAVHHHRQVRRCRDRLRGHRQGRRQEGHFLLPGADRDARLHRRPHRGKDGPARLRHRADPLRELPRAGLGPARPGGRRLPHRAVQSRSRPHRHRRPVGRHGARRFRGGRALRQGARHLRRADHRAPGASISASPTWPPSSTPPA